MERKKPDRGDWYWIVLYAAYGAAMVAQLCLLFLLRAGGVPWLRVVGWSLFAISAVLGWWPILTFRRRGRVERGKTYLHTTELVTSGLYSVVRHPQYLASDFLALAVMCITQHWGTLVVGSIAIGVNHWTMRKADRNLVEKFGDAYAEYSQRVPQWNLACGLIRRLRHKKDR